MTADPMAQILYVLQIRGATSAKLRKDELLSMRSKVIQIASTHLGQEIEEPQYVIGEPDPDYITALRCVMSYEGRNVFMRDLRRAIETYGGLTDRQAEAVLRSPDPEQVDEMKKLGVEADAVRFRFQAQEVLTEARRRARELAKETA